MKAYKGLLRNSSRKCSRAGTAGSSISAREVWLNAKHTKEDEIFSLDKKKVGTK